MPLKTPRHRLIRGMRAPSNSKPGFSSAAVRWSWTSVSLRRCSKAARRIRVSSSEGSAVPDMVVQIGGLADRKKMSGNSPWLKYDSAVCKRSSTVPDMVSRVAGSSSGAPSSSEPAPAIASWSRSVGMGRPINREGRQAETNRPGILALQRRGSMRQAFRATNGQRCDGWPQSRAHRTHFQRRLNEILECRGQRGQCDAANAGRVS